MYKKSKLNTLFILFIILLIIVAVIKLIDYSRGDRTFKSDITSTDTTLVTAIKFYPKSENYKEVKLERIGKIWKLIFDKKTMYADQSMVKTMLAEIANMKTERIAATEKSKWKDYAVDEKEGTRVKVEYKDKIISDFIIGKFSYSKSPNPYMQRGTMATYIRLMNDDKVYAVNGYLSMLFNRGVNSLRNGQLVSVNKDDISKLTFIYPGDSSFALIKNGTKWMLNDSPADSSKTINYLNNINRIYSDEFADDFNLSNLAKPVYTLRMEGTNFNPAEIKVYAGDAAYKYIITSSMNEGVKFNGDKNNLFSRIFIGKNKLL